MKPKRKWRLVSVNGHPPKKIVQPPPKPDPPTIPNWMKVLNIIVTVSGWVLWPIAAIMVVASIFSGRKR